jgi:hypothetical protein
MCIFLLASGCNNSKKINNIKSNNVTIRYDIQKIPGYIYEVDIDGQKYLIYRESIIKK